MVEHRYIPMRRRYASNVGLSEQQMRKQLEREGWTIWRGGSLHLSRLNELYPNVRRKYDKLVELFERDFPGQLELLQYMCVVHHGMPDYLCYRQKTKEWKFVECKFKHEQLSERQKICIPKLQELGFTVEVHKLVDHQTKTRKADVDLKSGVKKVKEQQLKLSSKKIKEKTRENKKVLMQR